jgi:tRNA(Ile)-lysidine synthase
LHLLIIACLISHIINVKRNKKNAIFAFFVNYFLSIFKNVDILAKFKTEILQVLPSINGLKLGLAVSGGSDSLALCFLLQESQNDLDFQLKCITIDHKLRSESSKEALKVNALLNNYNLNHCVIAWEGEKPSSNLQEEARIARYKLLTDFCHQNNITHLLTAHQKNDQAENFIIRADHGSGVYGLAGISPTTKMHGINIIRPLLNFSKEELQEFLRSRNIEWIEDPSNQNEHFARVKARNFLNQHQQWIPKLASISKNLARAKDSIEYIVNKSINEMATISDQSASIELKAFNDLPQEIRFRMMAKILQEVSQNEKSARGERIENLLIKIEAGKEFKASTLSDCLIKRKKNQLVITLENK